VLAQIQGLGPYYRHLAEFSRMTLSALRCDTLSISLSPTPYPLTPRKGWRRRLCLGDLSHRARTGRDIRTNI